MTTERLSIKKLTIEKMYNEEDYGFQTKVRELAKELLKEKEDQLIIEAFNTALDEFDKALKDSERSLYTEKIELAEAATDKSWRGVNHSVIGSSKFLDPTLAPLGKLALLIVEKYGDITRMGQNEKYGSLKNIIDDFNTKFTAEEQAQILLNKWIPQLQTCYDDFKALHAERTTETASHVAGIVKEKRYLSDQAYRDLVDVINVRIITNKKEDYKAFVDQVNTLINDAHAVLASRKTRAENKKKEEDEKSVGEKEI